MVRCGQKRQSTCHFQCAQLLFSLPLSLKSAIPLITSSIYFLLFILDVNHYHSSVYNDRIHREPHPRLKTQSFTLTLSLRISFKCRSDQKWKFCPRLLALVSFQTCITLFIHETQKKILTAESPCSFKWLSSSDLKFQYIPLHKKLSFIFRIFII